MKNQLKVEEGQMKIIEGGDLSSDSQESVQNKQRILIQELRLLPFTALLRKFAKKCKTRMRVIDELKTTERKYVEDIGTLLVRQFFEKISFSMPKSQNATFFSITT